MLSKSMGKLHHRLTLGHRLLTILSLLIWFRLVITLQTDYGSAYMTALINQQKLYQNQQHLNQSQSITPDAVSSPQPCCSCDEAKYELIFEGLWSKYTHPDDFPDSENVAYFGDIIGASHSDEFRMWEQGQLASEGVKELAESGSTKQLESELKASAMKTRTIIKARELRYPTLNSRTSAVFRTDKRHHLVSILSKLGPSPDWMVGVSALDLCQPDCSWSSQRIVNLSPWDAGIDSGNNFTQTNAQATNPPEPIHPLRRQAQSLASPVAGAPKSFGSMQPSNRRPGLDTNINMNQPSGVYNNPSDSINNPDQSKPFARLTITRQRIYEKSCNHSDQAIPPMSNPVSSNPRANSIDQQSTTDIFLPLPTPSYGSDGRLDQKLSQSMSDCRYTEWSDWTSCSSSCGKGIRTRIRSYKNDRYAQSGCSPSGLMEKEICLAECSANVTCYTRDWSSWSRCSVDCGQGKRKRVRSIIGPKNQGACDFVDLVEEEPCIGMGDCSNFADSHREPNSDSQPDTISCKVSPWSAWTECNRPCGGTRIRTRQYLSSASMGRCKIQLIQKRQCPVNADLCRNSYAEAGHRCNQPPEEGPCFGAFSRWYYDNTTRSCRNFIFGGCIGNENNFETIQDCEQSCLKPLRLKGNPLTEPDLVSLVLP